MSKRRITQIPLHSSSGRTPTGAIQFQDDWPGLFVRGDDAIGLMLEIEVVEQVLKEKCKRSLPPILKELAAVIRQDVIVRPETEDRGEGER